MRKIFKILIGLLALFTLFVGTWLAVNLWPRELEPPLWTKADIAVPEEKEKNGYYFFLEMKENPDPTRALDSFEDEAAIDSILYKVYSPETDAILFWKEVAELKPTLAKMWLKMAGALEEYRKLLDHPQFVDVEPITIIDPVNHPSWIRLLNLHKIGTLYILDQILEGNRDTADAFWLKMVQMDQAWALSARSMISQMVAIGILQKDLALLSLMRDFPPSKESEKITQTLRNFDVKKLNFRRALIFGYLFSLAAEDLMASGEPLVGFEGVEWKVMAFLQTMKSYRLPPDTKKLMPSGKLV